MLPGRLLSILTFICSACLLTGCQLEDPPPADTVLRLSLNDSLKQYENVVITIVDAVDTNKLLEDVWSGPIAEPSNLPGYTLTKAKGKDFVVRVKGYKDGDQLFLETLIYYQGGKKTVVHKAVPPYKPRNRLISLTASKGTLSPAFNQDSLLYTLSTALGVSTLTLTAAPIYSGARIVIFGDTLSGGNSQPIPVGLTQDTIGVLVTDSSQGIAYTLAYKVVLNPTLPPTAKLKSMTSSSGTLRPAFHPDSTIYTLELAATVPSVRFTLATQDPSTMIMKYKGTPLFEGTASPPILVESGLSMDALFIVSIPGGSVTNYQIFINRL